MNLDVSTSMTLGPISASGARVVVVTTRHVLTHPSGHQASETTICARIVLGSGQFLPNAYTSEADAQVALDQYEHGLQATGAPRRRGP